MNPPELARRLCDADQAHVFRLSTNARPCGRHLGDAERYWGLAADPSMKAEFDVIVQFRRDKLGKHK